MLITVNTITRRGRNGILSPLSTFPSQKSNDGKGKRYRSSRVPKTALILGKPGGGKGTISGKILQDFPSVHHLSSGDVLRQHVRNQTNIGKAAKRHMDAGHLVPDDLMIQLVLQDCNTVVKNYLLLDGFPRTIHQATALEKSLDIGLVINLDIPTETIVERISDRWIHPSSGRIYSYSYRAPIKKGVDDVTGEPLIQRDDDKPESVRRRLEAYEKVTAPIIEYYEAKGVVKTFSGTQSDSIYMDVKQWLVHHIV